MDDVTVVYRQMVERIASFKEYALRWLGGRPAYREIPALENVSVVLHPGELLAVVGRNGAGKSTLLKVMARVLVPTRGRLRVRGRVAPLIELGAAFHSDLSAEENVYLNGSLLGYDDGTVRARFGEVVAFAELEGKMHQPLREFSSGMTARLGFAVATMRRPDVLLVDEALAVGDAAFQAKCLDRIAAFRAMGTAIVLVSHQDDALLRCDRALLLDQGQVVSDGDPVLVAARYRARLGIEEPAVASALVTDDSPLDVNATTEDSDAEAMEQDRATVAILRQRSASPDSVFGAFQLFAEFRAAAVRHGFDVRRVLQLGPGCLPATLACFLATGSERAVAAESLAQKPMDRSTLRLLAEYVAAVGGAGWWRHDAECYRGSVLSSPALFDTARVVEHMAAVELGWRRATDDDDATFSFAFAMGSLEHTADPEGALRRLHGELDRGAGVVLDIALADLSPDLPLATLEEDEATYAERCDRRPPEFRLPSMPPGLPPGLAFRNRWRVSDYERALMRVGFEVMAIEPLVVCRHELVDRERLAEPYRSKTIDDLAILSVRITARAKD